jgi:hypothetical protein
VVPETVQYRGTKKSLGVVLVDIKLSAYSQILIFAFTVGLTVDHARAEACIDLTEADKDRLINYVRKLFLVKQDSQLAITAVKPVLGCYRILTFESTHPLKNFQTTLYLSPDKQLLFQKVYDTAIDPLRADESAKRNVSLLKQAPPGPQLGSSSAAISMVVFSDFQCPYCRTFAQSTIKRLLARKDISIEYRYFLSQVTLGRTEQLR